MNTDQDTIKDNNKGLPLRRAITYTLLAGLWIIGSDWLLAKLTGDRGHATILHTYKGWLFVIITGAAFYGVLRHELRKLQQEIQSRRVAEEALRKSEAQLIRAQQVAKMGNFTWDAETGEITWSKGMYDLLRYDQSDPIDSELVKTKIQHPEDLERVSQWLDSSLAATSTEMPACEYRVIRKDGEIIHIRNQGIIERHEGRKPLIFATVVDITDHIKNEQEREILQTQVVQAQKMESVGRLAGGVAHDFNNILSVIMGYTEIALMKVKKDDPLHDDLTEVLTAAKRSTNITRQLLAFARKQAIAPQVLDLNSTVEKMLKMLHRLIGEDIDLAWRPGANLARIKIDPSQIDQLLANLCINARDAISGVGQVVIETGMVSLDNVYCAAHAGFAPGDYVTLTVSDNGSGIDQEALNYLFEPFYSTKEVGKGTGLGLATVFGIVKQNNGFIDVSSAPGHGARFTIYLPMHDAEPEVEETSKEAGADIHGAETILVVEDAQAILNLTSRMLGQLGYTVITAERPVEAIAAAENQETPIDLLLTDVVMPDMNGRELSELLQKRYPSLKVLFMSGYTVDVIAHRGILKEGVHFIAKPFSRQELSIKVREALNS
jgi:two-component system, cell cycle sensor histidine kinase and response regulator CckA